jgi:hypothetical protein
VWCTVRTKGTKPGQLGQRSTDEVQRENKKKFHPGQGCLCFVRCTVKGKGKMQENKDKETTSDEVETE